MKKNLIKKKGLDLERKYKRKVNNNILKEINI